VADHPEAGQAGTFCEGVADGLQHHSRVRQQYPAVLRPCGVFRNRQFALSLTS
jgi:hypothetical protein